MICSFIMFTVAFAILRRLFGRLWARVKDSEKPMNWRKRFRRATVDNEDDKKDQLIDIEKPKKEEKKEESKEEKKEERKDMRSSPSSGEPKATVAD
jgi:hypothetical protein